MKKVISVSFKGNNKRYYFEPIDSLKLNDYVVVETIRGLEIGRISEDIKEIKEEEIIGELKKVLRLATKKDLEDYENNLKDKPEVSKKIKEIISKSGLEMKFLDSEYTLDRSKLLIYFSADSRIDFRELVKEIASIFKTRIELRQVGPRDESRMVSGIGICGRRCCCSEFLGDIQNVTIKMAKNQNLSLNPNSISGLCGKLLCCISYEDSMYTDTKKELPSVGDILDLESGKATVTNVNVQDENVSVKFEDGRIELINYKKD